MIIRFSIKRKGDCPESNPQQDNQTSDDQAKPKPRIKDEIVRTSVCETF